MEVTLKKSFEVATSNFIENPKTNARK